MTISCWILWCYFFVCYPYWKLHHVHLTSVHAFYQISQKLYTYNFQYFLFFAWNVLKMFNHFWTKGFRKWFLFHLSSINLPKTPFKLLYSGARPTIKTLLNGPCLGFSIFWLIFWPPYELCVFLACICFILCWFRLNWENGDCWLAIWWLWWRLSNWVGIKLDWLNWCWL